MKTKTIKRLDDVVIRLCEECEKPVQKDSGENTLPALLLQVVAETADEFRVIKKAAYDFCSFYCLSQWAAKAEGGINLTESKGR